MNELASARFTLRLPSSELVRCAQSAQSLNITRSEMIRRAVASYLQKQNPIVS